MATDMTLAVGEPAEEVGSPLWWLRLLNRRLEARRPSIETFDAYYEGQHPLAFATSKFREAFGDLFAEFADNWCEVVVDAAAERLEVQGFRFGDSEEADSEVWDLWQENGLDAHSSLAMLEAIKLGEAYALVEPRGVGNAPRVTIEHPLQAIVATDPGDRRRRVAGLKKWRDDDGILYATLYLPGKVYRFRSKKRELGAGLEAEWVARDDDLAVVENPLGVVPLVPIVNSPTLLRGGRSDLLKVIPLQNAVNKLVSDLIVASEFAAFRQRLLSGVEVPTYPEGHEKAGEPMSDVFVSAVSRILVTENPDARAQEFGATDLGNYVRAIEMVVQHVAAQTRTPPHYLMGQVVNASGDALKSAETGLSMKSKGKARHFGGDWEETAWLMRQAKRGESAADRTEKLETIWGDFENRSTGEQVDAGTKEAKLGVPLRSIWIRRLGATPQEADRWERARREEEARLIALGLAGTRSGDQGVPDEPAEPVVAGAPDGGTPAGVADAG